MPTMIISLNFLISAVAYPAGILLYKKGHLYNSASKFMFFLATAALFGGFVHQMELYSTQINFLINDVNATLPHFLEPLSYTDIHTRLWFITINAIGFSEFFLMYLFLEPLTHNKFTFMPTYLKVALSIFVLVTLFSTQYFFVVLFHVFSHVVIISFSLYYYSRTHLKPILYLTFTLIFNLSIGILQQLMDYSIIPSGPLNYNDWYHIGVTGLVIAFYWLFTKGELIEDLQANSTPVHSNK